MRVLARLGLIAAVALAAATTFAASAFADSCHDGFAGPVFVQTDNPAGNQVVAYDRNGNGTLSYERTYATGGKGGVLAGSVVDHLASQGSLTFDPAHGVLYAVNAGSNTVSVFAVDGDDLVLEQVVGSDGTFPVSVAVHGDLVYVLNAEDGGSIQGYVAAFGHLSAVGAWHRGLGLDPTATPQFTTTPGQVLFSPDGTQLLVTTKANTNAVDVFGVGPFGHLSAVPVVNLEAGAVPFALAFDAHHHVLVTEAGPDTVASFSLAPDGILTPVATQPTGQAATCWIARAWDTVYASNAGSASLSAVHSNGAGQLTLLGTTTTDPGTVDAAVSGDGAFLYVQTGATGTVDEFAIGHGATLDPIGSVVVPDAAGGEGIVAL